VVKRAKEELVRHFDAVLYASFWINASVLAILVGRPLLGAIGLVTVAPALVLYGVRARRR
jgi:hypothetical protein